MKISQYFLFCNILLSTSCRNKSDYSVAKTTKANGYHPDICNMSLSSKFEENLKTVLSQTSEGKDILKQHSSFYDKNIDIEKIVKVLFSTLNGKKELYNTCLGQELLVNTSFGRDKIYQNIDITDYSKNYSLISNLNWMQLNKVEHIAPSLIKIGKNIELIGCESFPAQYGGEAYFIKSVQTAVSQQFACLQKYGRNKDALFLAELLKSTYKNTMGIRCVSSETNYLFNGDRKYASGIAIASTSLFPNYPEIAINVSNYQDENKINKVGSTIHNHFASEVQETIAHEFFHLLGYIHHEDKISKDLKINKSINDPVYSMQNCCFKQDIQACERLKTLPDFSYNKVHL